MATSGNTILSIYDWCSLKFSWWENSQSIADNTTTIGWKLEFVTGNGSLYVYSKPWEVYIDGTKYDGTSKIEATKNSTVQVASGTSTVSHNSDGSKTFPYSFKMTFDVTLNNGKYMSSYSGSGSGTLDTIARASQPSLVTWPETTNDVGDFGETFSIHMNRASASFTHTVWYEYGDRTGVIAKDVGTGTTWAVPLDFMNDIPDKTSASGRIYVDTYNGSTKIGTKYTGFTVTVPASVKPTCSIQVLDATNIKDTYGSLVKGLSKLYVKTTFNPAYSSPVAAYNVTANGTKYTAAEITTGVLTNAGTTKVTATVKDKRGRTSEEASASFSVMDYQAPAVSTVTAVRCNEDGSANRRGDHIKVTFSASVTSLNSKNPAIYYLYYKQSGDSAYTEVSLTNYTNNYSVVNGEYKFYANKGKSYDVIVRAVDRHKEGQRSVKVPTAFAVFSWRGFATSEGVEDGAGIGMIPDRPNTLQIAFETEFRGKVSGSIFDAIYPVGSIYIAYNKDNPSKWFGGEWDRIENAFLWAIDDSGTIGKRDGEKTHTLTVNELPVHSHGSVYSQNAAGTKSQAWYSSSGDKLAYGVVETGGGAAHNNMPPYIQVSVWRRTA